MKLKRLGSIFLAAAMMTAALTGCGGGDSKAEGGDSKAEGGKSTVTLWATGSDNVRSIFEKLPRTSTPTPNTRISIRLSCSSCSPVPARRASQTW